MLGWLSEASRRASRVNRASRSASAVNPGGSQLGRDVAAEPRVVRAVDLAHTAAAEQRLQVIDADVPSDPGRFGRRRWPPPRPPPVPVPSSRKPGIEGWSRSNCTSRASASSPAQASAETRDILRPGARARRGRAARPVASATELMSGRGRRSSYTESSMSKARNAGTSMSSAPAHPRRLAARCQVGQPFAHTRAGGHAMRAAGLGGRGIDRVFISGRRRAGPRSRTRRRHPAVERTGRGDRRSAASADAGDGPHRGSSSWTIGISWSSAGVVALAPGDEESGDVG